MNEQNTIIKYVFLQQLLGTRKLLLNPTEKVMTILF